MKLLFALSLLTTLPANAMNIKDQRQSTNVVDLMGCTIRFSPSIGDIIVGERKHLIVDFAHTAPFTYNHLRVFIDDQGSGRMRVFDTPSSHSAGPITSYTNQRVPLPVRTLQVEWRPETPNTIRVITPLDRIQVSRNARGCTQQKLP